MSNHYIRSHYYVIQRKLHKNRDVISDSHGAFVGTCSDIPEQYKTTELGVLPKDWVVKQIGSFTSTKSGGTPSTTNEEFWKNGTIPWINSGALKDNYINTSNDFITISGLENSSAKLFPKNTVVIALTGTTTGRVGLLTIDSSTNQSVVGIFPNNKFISEFLFYYLMFARNQVLQLRTGAAQPHINKAIVDNFLIPLPPLPEQRAIAATLRTVQEAKEKTDAVIAATKALKAAMMKHLFTYGPMPPEEAEKIVLKETEIGPVPEGWDVKNLKEVSKIYSGGTPSKDNPDFWEGEIPWASPKDLKSLILDDVIDHISEEGLTVGSRLVPENSIFIVIRGMILIRDVPVSIITRPMAFNQDMKAICANSKISPMYLLYAISQYRMNLARHIGTSAHGTKRISTSAIEDFLVPIPSEKVQGKIVEILDSIERKLASEQSHRQALDTLFTTLLHDIMTAKIGVKVPATAE